MNARETRAIGRGRERDVRETYAEGYDLRSDPLVSEGDLHGFALIELVSVADRVDERFFQ